jgi:drug/metabolite transporter (DMT)-like permease
VSKGDPGDLFKGNFGEAGDVLILVSAVNWAVFSILSKGGLQKHHATLMMFYVMTIGWLFTSILFFTSGNITDVGNLTWRSLIAICFLGIFCSGLAYIAWYDGLKAIPASQVGAFLYIEPLVAVIAWLVLETDNSITLAGGVIILIGVRMVRYQ